MLKLACFFVVLGLAACSSEAPVEAPPPGQPASQPAVSRPASQPVVSADPVDPFAEPDTAFAHQYDLLRAIDVEGLRTCMVEKVRSEIEKADLEAAEQRMRSVPVTDIAAAVVRRGDEADIVLKSSAVLTTLVRVDGKWLAQERWWIKK